MASKKIRNRSFLTLKKAKKIAENRDEEQDWREFDSGPSKPARDYDTLSESRQIRDTYSLKEFDRLRGGKTWANPSGQKMARPPLEDWLDGEDWRADPTSEPEHLIKGRRRDEVLDPSPKGRVGKGERRSLEASDKLRRSTAIRTNYWKSPEGVKKRDAVKKRLHRNIGRIAGRTIPGMIAKEGLTWLSKYLRK